MQQLSAGTHLLHHAWDALTRSAWVSWCAVASLSNLIKSRLSQACLGLLWERPNSSKTGTASVCSSLASTQGSW